ncbi:MAG: MurR/RpiR family transcriptional regulator [Coprobacillaceae bacterium]
MSCIQRMKAFPNFTKTEEKIRSYILKHLDLVIHETAQSLADKTETSAAAIIRFSKNLGYSGFTDLKISLASEAKSDWDVGTINERIENNDSLDTIINKAKTSDINAIEQTYDLLDKENLHNAIESLRTAKTVYLMGIGSSGICCSDLFQKLLRIHVNAVFLADFHVQMATMAHITKDDILIGVSYSGETAECVTALKFAKKAGATTIGITQIPKNSLHKYIDIPLYIPTTEKDLRLGAVTSRNASLIITDLLYIGLIRKDLESYKEILRHTRNVVKEINVKI